MPYPNEHAARVKDPADFEDDSFRNKELKGVAGIRIIVAKLKGDDAMTLQAYRFSVNQFTVEQAKQWLKDHKVTYILFEPADNKSKTGGSMNNIKNKIEHTGIMGMKWGHRSGGGGGGGHGKKKTSTTSAEHKLVGGLKKKKVSDMTNEELKTVATRMQLEQQYRSLNPTKLSIGKAAVMGVVSGVAKNVASQASQYAAKKIFDFALGAAKMTP